jgi:hypothetical protein
MHDIIPQLLMFCFLMGYFLFLVVLTWSALGPLLIRAVKTRSARLRDQAQRVLRSPNRTFRQKSLQQGGERRGNFHKA